MRGSLAIAGLAPLLAAGCFSPNSVTCSDGTICPAGSRCDDKNRCRSGSGWSQTTFFTTELTGVWASGPDNAYAVGGPSQIQSGTISHWDGIQWSSSGPGGGLQSLSAVWGSGPDDVFVVGSPTDNVIHWDGSLWSTSMLGSWSLMGVWGSASDDVFVVGWNGSRLQTLDRWDGVSWTIVPTDRDTEGRLGGSYALNGVWASGPSDIFWVGDGGVARWDGTSVVSNAQVAGQRAFWGVWGSGPDDVFAVGDGGAIVHWDGALWSTMNSGTMAQLRAVSGSGPGDVFAGGEGVLLHLEGGAWEPMSFSGVTSISGLAVTPTRVFVVGFGGEVHLDRPGAH
jgi:hypothetical protein